MLENKLILIAGGGHFGKEAMISAKNAGARVVLIDDRESCPAGEFADEKVRGYDFERISNLKPGFAVFFVSDAVNFLLKFLKSETPDFIAPAIPGHLAAKVVKKSLEDEGLKVNTYFDLDEILEDIPKSLLINSDKGNGIIVLSYMPKDKLCQLPCDQPKDFCKTTKRPKAALIYKILEFALWNKVNISTILKSYKLEKAVGSFKGDDMCGLLDKLKKIQPPYTLAIGTSCGCHGVVNIFSVSPFTSLAKNGIIFQK